MQEQLWTLITLIIMYKQLIQSYMWYFIQSYSLSFFIERQQLTKIKLMISFYS